MPDLPARIGRYEVRSLLGQGGMGRIYLAFDPTLDRLLALKVLRGDDHDDDGAAVQERFAREARAAARLGHPNIVTIYDVGVHDGQPFIAMEYVPGETLASVIRSRRPRTLKDCLGILKDIASGLDYLHRSGLVHRDVKPGNVMVTPDGAVKILDFGVARIVHSSITVSGTFLGSPSYMSPEQVRGEAADHRSDIFSLGSVMYELLSEHRAFQGDSLAAIAMKISTGAAAPLAQLAPQLPANIVGIVERAMQANPSDRYQSMTLMMRDLEEARRSVNEEVDVFGRRAAPEADPGRDADVAAERTMLAESSAPAPIGASPPAPDFGTMVVPPASSTAKETDEPSARLVVTESADPHLANQSFVLAGASFEIGREGGDLRSSDSTWSRRHAVIEYRDRGFVIHDLGSANGTFVNGRAVDQAASVPLFFGARIAIGNTLFTFAPTISTSVPDVTGLEIADRYVLKHLLRESARGAIYVAQAKTLPRVVALKLLSPALLRYAGYRERFHRQAEIAAQLQHPHICNILDYGDAVLTPAGHPPLRTHYLCLDLMGGGSLSDRLAAKSLIDVADVARWLESLASALTYAHDQHVIHGDLKPSAVVFDRASSSNAYLTDFAIGQPLEGAASDHGLVGTPAYMAPEQWAGAPVTPATDQYGLAVLAYYMLTGNRPFEGQDHPEIRRRNFAQGPLPAHEEAAQRGRTDLRPKVSHVLRRGLAADPLDRYGSVEEFTRSLVTALTRPGDDRDENAPPRVFVSYHRGSGSGWANFIAGQLREKHGLDVFLDVQRIDGVSQFPQRLANAIKQADVFVCLLTPTAPESRWILEEIRLAHEHHKPMIPVFHENFVVPDVAPAAASTPLATLLSYDAVRLLDIQNLYVDAAVTDIATRIKETVRRRGH
jgi:serine/threonine protein kinase